MTDAPRITLHASTIPGVRCETCRFWTDHRRKDNDWGSCSRCTDEDNDTMIAYPTNEDGEELAYQTAALVTRPFHGCSMWETQV